MPKTLFRTGPDIRLENPLLTVYVCDQCNNDKSKDDDDLRDFLAVRLQYMGHPDISHLIAGFTGSAQYGSSTLARRFATDGRLARHPSTGLILPNLISVEIDNDKLSRSIKSIVRGLYYEETRKIKAPRSLSAEYVYEFTELHGDDINEWIFAFAGVEASPRAIGNFEFEYQLKRFPQEPDTTLWTLSFFGALFYMGYTYPSGVASGRDHIKHLYHDLMHGSDDTETNDANQPAPI